MCFYIFLGGKKKFEIFLKNFFEKFFLGQPLEIFFFQSLKFHIFIPFYDYHCFWTQKCPLEAFNKGGHIVPPPRVKYQKLEPV